MKKNILNSYSAPTFNVYEVAVDKGFAASLPEGGGFINPDFGSEDGGDLEPWG
jgi:hypothetical protein